MKKQVTQKKCFNKKPGFTLVEVAIAMGMVAVMISSFMVVFGPALQGIDKSLSAKEADRLTNALELELSVPRSGETYASGFEKAFWWIKQSVSDSKNPVLIYQYRGNPNSVRTDGTLNPYPYNAANPGIPGVNYVIQTSVRRLNDTFHTSKIQAELAPGVLEGKVYYARLTQLRYDTSGKMVPTTSENNITKLQPTHGNTATPADYTDDGVLPFRARFYEVKPPLWSYINATWSVADVGNPVITKNMAVMR
jgi:type II secretory pathway pseudopilin PulG